jgi:sulfur carrier protein
VIINGKNMNFKDGITVTLLLNELNLSLEKAVVEVNFQIISKEAYSAHRLYEADTIEIVSFVGGG